eukprot:2553321-Pleurochrysis_carterae.AAC.1
MSQEGGGCCESPEKEVDTISRSSILVYNVELTDGSKGVNALSKEQIMEAIHSQSPFVFEKLPAK